MFGNCVKQGGNNSHFSIRCEKLARKRDLAWDRSFQPADVTLTPKAWELAGISLWKLCYSCNLNNFIDSAHLNFTSNDPKNHRLKGRLKKFLTQKINIRNKTSKITKYLSVMTQITLNYQLLFKAKLSCKYGWGWCSRKCAIQKTKHAPGICLIGAATNVKNLNHFPCNEREEKPSFEQNYNNMLWKHTKNPWGGTCILPS